MKNYIKAFATVVLCLYGMNLWAQIPVVTPVNENPDGVRITAVHPNPATERIMIEFTATGWGDEVLLRVRNAEGKIILKRTLITAEGGNAVILPVGAFPSGEYVVQLDEGRHLRAARWQKM